jgi:hypothetical protein
MSKFGKKQTASNTDSDQVNLASVQRFVNNIKADTKLRPGHALVAKEITGTAIAFEGFREEDVRSMETALKGVEVSLESLLEGTDFKASLTTAQKDAFTYAAAISGDAQASRSFDIRRAQPALEGVTYINPTGGDMHYEAPQRAALEAYDERDNRHVTTYTTTYNMLASRQGPFAEMFFPTITVAPDQVGFETTIRLNYVMTEVKSNIDGSIAQFNRKNLIQAAIDPTIFGSDQTKVIPVYRDESKAKFVASTLLTPRPVMMGDEEVTTSALKIGAKLGLLPISQTDALLKTGTIDYSDALDASIELDTVYIKLVGSGAQAGTTELFKFNTKRLPTAVFTHALQGLDRQMNLVFKGDAFTFSKDTKTVAGVASVLLAAMGTNTARVSVGITGEVNLQTSETQLWARPCEATLIRNEDGEVLPHGAGAGATIATLLGGAVVEGYELNAHRVNTNQRQRGELLDTVYYNQIYTVPLRSPISVARPRGASEENDASDLASLITATHFKINNDAVKTLLEAADFLAEYVRDIDNYETAPAILGVARHLVTAYFRRQTIDLRDIVQSLTSADRRENIQQALVMVIRDHVYNMYRDSGWQPAADSLAGGDAGKPVVKIGTDPVIAGWLCVGGDTRLLGTDMFDVQVEATYNRTMKGKLVITFGQRGNSGKHNPMEFGNMAYKSELALILPTHRNGQNSKELMVTPSYLHVVNCPIMVIIDVEGVSEVATGKVAIPTQEVA